MYNYYLDEKKNKDKEKKEENYINKKIETIKRKSNSLNINNF